MPKLSVSRLFTNGDPLLVTLVPLSGICSKVCVTFGIWLVFVFVWTEVDTQISTYAPTYVTVQGLGAQLCVALFGTPSQTYRQLVACPWRERTTPGAVQIKGKYIHLLWQRRVLLRR